MIHPPRTRFAIALLCVLSLVGCTPPGVTVSTGPQQTTITGRLASEQRGDAGCAWIATTADQRVEVAYPNGWHVEFDPLLLFDEAGQRRARDGDTLSLTGYFQAVGASVCHPDRMFVATQVTAPP